MKNSVYIAIVLIISFSSCKNKEKMTAPTDRLPESSMVSATAIAIVYKTYKDFSKLVPVIMDAGKQKFCPTLLLLIFSTMENLRYQQL